MILAFDTATSFGAVCAVTPGRRDRAARAGDLLEAVDRLVADPAALEGIVVGRGPGSFTSIRIGLAVARALSLALDVRVAGASTLDAYRDGVPVIDARRGEVFEPRGATVPPDADPAHLPDALRLIERAGAFGAAELVEPLYVREPDAKASR